MRAIISGRVFGGENMCSFRHTLLDKGFYICFCAVFYHLFVNSLITPVQKGFRMLFQLPVLLRNTAAFKNRDLSNSVVANLFYCHC